MFVRCKSNKIIQIKCIREVYKAFPKVCKIYVKRNKISTCQLNVCEINRPFVWIFHSTLTVVVSYTDLKKYVPKYELFR